MKCPKKHAKDVFSREAIRKSNAIKKNREFQSYRESSIFRKLSILELVFFDSMKYGYLSNQNFIADLEN